MQLHPLGVTLIAVVILMILAVALCVAAVVGVADMLGTLAYNPKYYDEKLPRFFVQTMVNHRFARIAALVLAPLLYAAFGVFLLGMAMVMLCWDLPDIFRETTSDIRAAVGRSK